MPLRLGRADQEGQGRAFAAEVERLRLAAVPGESGRLRELFDFLAARGAEAGSASQAEIAEMVFGQTATEGDDATVRVYIHRLRKRLEDFYANEGADGPRLTLPAGTYALRLQEAEHDPESRPAPPPPTRVLQAKSPLVLGVVALGLALAAFFAGRSLPNSNDAPPVNALWQPFVDSQRPTLIVLGDYYIYGEIDPVRPEEGRLIRDFRVNSATDLVRMQDLEPDKFATSEDMGLNYLPFSAAYGLDAVLPELARGDRQITVIAASELEPDMLNRYDVVYVGLLSGMHLLEDMNFMNSGFQIGESYDELIDTDTGKSYISEEARRLASPSYYRDYGYVARFRSPSGALVAILAGARDTGLRGIAPLLSRRDLPTEVERLAIRDQAFEALYQITGQQGADLSERLITAEPRS